MRPPWADPFAAVARGRRRRAVRGLRALPLPRIVAEEPRAAGSSACLMPPGLCRRPVRAVRAAAPRSCSRPDPGATLRVRGALPARAAPHRRRPCPTGTRRSSGRSTFDVDVDALRTAPHEQLFHVRRRRSTTDGDARRESVARSPARSSCRSTELPGPYGALRLRVRRREPHRATPARPRCTHCAARSSRRTRCLRSIGAGSCR